MRKAGDTRELSVLYRDLRLLRRQFDLIKLGYLRKDYDPSQPRVPAGSPRGGEWSRIGLPVSGGLRSGGRERPASQGRNATSEPIRVAARRISRAREAQCEAQHRTDMFQCRMVGLRPCYAQAFARYAACLSGSPIPPLNY